MQNKYEILGINQELFSKDIYFLNKPNLLEVDERDFYKKLIAYREDFLKNFYASELFGPFSEIVVCSSFKDLYPQEYEKMEMPLCETIVCAQGIGHKFYVAMLNMKMMDQEEVQRNIASLNIL